MIPILVTHMDHKTVVAVAVLVVGALLLLLLYVWVRVCLADCHPLHCLHLLFQHDIALVEHSRDMNRQKAQTEKLRIHKIELIVHEQTINSPSQNWKKQQLSLFVAILPTANFRN